MNLKELELAKQNVDEELTNCNLIKNIENIDETNKLFNDAMNIELESKDYDKLSIEHQCALIMGKKAKSQAYAEGIEVARELIKDEISFLKGVQGVLLTNKESSTRLDNRIKQLKEQLGDKA